MHGVPLITQGDFEPIPGFYAIVIRQRDGSYRPAQFLKLSTANVTQLGQLPSRSRRFAGMVR